MCHLGEVSRAGFYRSLQERQALEEDMEDSLGEGECIVENHVQLMIIPTIDNVLTFLKPLDFEDEEDGDAGIARGPIKSVAIPSAAKVGSIGRHLRTG